MKEYHLAIIGSRNFDDYGYMETVLDKQYVWLLYSTIVSGGAVGADSLAMRYALENDMGQKEFLPNPKHGFPAALFIRNVEIVTNSHFVFAFWDLKSGGTRHALCEAFKQNKPAYIFNKKFGYEPLAFNPNIKYDTDFDVLDKFLE